MPTVTKRELTAALPEIVKVHQMLRDELTTLLADWDDSRSQVGPLFVRFSPFFKLYNSYCANYNSFMHQINRRLNKPDSELSLLVARLKATLLAEHGERLDLPSLLIMPVQRIPRYRLLLTELRDATAPENADHEPTTKALELVVATAQKVNESVAARANRLDE